MSNENDIWISDVHRISSWLGTNDTLETETAIAQSTIRPHSHTAYLGLFCILGITGMALNATMIVIYTRGKRKMLNKMVSNRFNLNLVIVHLLQVSGHRRTPPQE